MAQDRQVKEIIDYIPDNYDVNMLHLISDFVRQLQYYISQDANNYLLTVTVDDVTSIKDNLYHIVDVINIFYNIDFTGLLHYVIMLCEKDRHDNAYAYSNRGLTIINQFVQKLEDNPEPNDKYNWQIVEKLSQDRSRQRLIERACARSIMSYLSSKYPQSVHLDELFAELKLFGDTYMCRIALWDLYMARAVHLDIDKDEVRIISLTKAKEANIV